MHIAELLLLQAFICAVTTSYQYTKEHSVNSCETVRLRTTDARKEADDQATCCTWLVDKLSSLCGILAQPVEKPLLSAPQRGIMLVPSYVTTISHGVRDIAVQDAYATPAEPQKMCAFV